MDGGNHHHQQHHHHHHHHHHHQQQQQQQQQQHHPMVVLSHDSHQLHPALVQPDIENYQEQDDEEPHVSVAGSVPAQEHANSSSSSSSMPTRSSPNASSSRSSPPSLSPPPPSSSLRRRRRPKIRRRRSTGLMGSAIGRRLSRKTIALVLGAHMHDHIADRARWAKEAWGALVVAPSVRAQLLGTDAGGDGDGAGGDRRPATPTTRKKKKNQYRCRRCVLALLEHRAYVPRAAPLAIHGARR